MLEDFLSKDSIDRLKQSLIQRQFLHIPQASHRNIDSLMPWKTVNTILWQARLEAPRLRIHKDGEQSLESKYLKRRALRRGSSISRIDEEKFYEELRNGGTLVIDAIEELHPPLNEFIYALERFFHEKIQVNAYMSWGETRGFSTHWDDHDVIIIQIHGQKNWFIFGETRKNPMYRDFHHQEEAPTQPIWNEVINAGDILFIPRGWWHHANALNAPSLHLTLGFNSRTGLNFLQSLQDKLAQNELCRQEIPRFGTEEAMQSYEKNLKAELVKAINEFTLKDFLKDCDTRLEKRTIFSLPWAITADGLPPHQDFKVRINATLITNYKVKVAEDVLEFMATDKKYQLSVKCEPFIKCLLDYNWHPFQEIIQKLTPQLDEETLRSLIKSLLLQGLLAISE